jgi:hypothetical protein
MLSGDERSHVCNSWGQYLPQGVIREVSILYESFTARQCLILGNDVQTVSSLLRYCISISWTTKPDSTSSLHHSHCSASQCKRPSERSSYPSVHRSTPHFYCRHLLISDFCPGSFQIEQHRNTLPNRTWYKYSLELTVQYPDLRQSL